MNSEERDQDQDRDAVITITGAMQEQMMKQPKLLNQAAGTKSCCIFRVPQTLLETNATAYKPHIVSIGPYHHGQQHLKMVEEQKWRYLREFINHQAPTNGLSLQDFVKEITPFEARIRTYYSETLDLEARDLIQMMVLDGFFIIKLFCRARELTIIQPVEDDDDDHMPFPDDDPLFKVPWIFPYLTRDLLQAENQIPFFVLEKLFNKSKISSGREEIKLSLPRLTLDFFNNMLRRPNEVLDHCSSLQGKHILDLYHRSFIPKLEAVPLKNRRKENTVLSIQLIQPAEKLRLAGIMFGTRNTDSFLDVKFHQGRLEIPRITLDDFTSSLLLNFVAYEQCYGHCSKHITAYATFMSCLVNTESDAVLLRDRNILENYYGSDEEVADFFHNLAKDVAFGVEDNYLATLFEDVNQYHWNDWHVTWAGFKHTYFSTPWSFISALAAVILLGLTMIQAFFALFPYVRPPGE